MAHLFKHIQEPFPESPAPLACIDHVQQMLAQSLDQKVAVIARMTAVAESIQTNIVHIDASLREHDRIEDSLIAEIVAVSDQVAEMHNITLPKSFKDDLVLDSSSR